MSEQFRSRWKAIDDSEMGDRRFSFWMMDSFPVVWVVCVFAFGLFAALFPLIVETANRDRMERFEQDINEYEEVSSVVAHRDEVWRTLRGGECFYNRFECARLRKARSYALIDGFDPHADTKEAAHFREIMGRVPPLYGQKGQLSLNQMMPIVYGSQEVPAVTLPEDPRSSGSPVQYEMIWWLYVWVVYCITGGVLSIALADSSRYWSGGRRYDGYSHPKNHTIGSRFAALLHAPTVVLWTFMLSVDVYDWTRWRVGRLMGYYAHKREEKLAKEKTKRAREEAEQQERVKREEVIAGLDDDLRANYYAILEAQREVRVLIDEAPDEDAEMKQSLMDQLHGLEQEILRVHEMQEERDRAARRMRFSAIASRVEGIVAEVRGRMELSAHITEEKREGVM